MTPEQQARIMDRVDYTEPREEEDVDEPGGQPHVRDEEEDTA